MQYLPHVRVPEEAGVSSQGILNYIAAREEAGLEHHAIWVIRHGKVAAKLNYAPYDDHTPHMLFSLSKSFCSAAAGFAVQEGLLNWDSKLIDVLPEIFPEEPSERPEVGAIAPTSDSECKHSPSVASTQPCAGEWPRAISLHHLLTMGSGLKPESDGGREGPDWARRVIAYGCDHAPGAHFHYNSMNTYLVSCMVQKVTGQTVRDYLVPRLFEPLGMMNQDGSAPKWDCSPDGVNVGGWGLWLSCAQIAPFGQCLLQKGLWDGRQILPREWLDLATTFRIDNGNGEHEHDHDWNMGYGYQFWMCRTDHEAGQTPRYRGDGMFSQFCIVDEKRDMVVCCVSCVGDIGKALTLIYDNLIAAADMAPADEAAQAELQRQLAAIAYPWPEHDGSNLPVGVYTAENDSSVLTIESDRVTFTLDDQHTALFFLHPVKGGCDVSCCGMKDGSLHLLLRVLNAPFTLDTTVHFDGDRADMAVNGVGLESKTFTLIKK